MVDDYTFRRTFGSTDVLYLKPNWKNANTVLQGLYGSYAKLIQYEAKSFLQSHGSKGILDISAMAQNQKNFDETLKRMLNEYFKTFLKAKMQSCHCSKDIHSRKRTGQRTTMRPQQGM